MAKSESTSLAFFFGGVARPEEVCDPFRTKTDTVVSAEQNFDCSLAENFFYPFDDALLVFALLLTKPSFAACLFKRTSVVMDARDVVNLALRDCEVNFCRVGLAFSIEASIFGSVKAVLQEFSDDWLRRVATAADHRVGETLVTCSMREN